MYDLNYNEEDSVEEINSLIGDINLVMDTDSLSLSLENLEEVKKHMSLVIEQGMFWLQQENPNRYIYDLKNFLRWLCDFVEENEH